MRKKSSVRKKSSRRGSRKMTSKKRRVSRKKSKTKRTRRSTIKKGRRTRRKRPLRVMKGGNAAAKAASLAEQRQREMWDTELTSREYHRRELQRIGQDPPPALIDRINVLLTKLGRWERVEGASDSVGERQAAIRAEEEQAIRAAQEAARIAAEVEAAEVEAAEEERQRIAAEEEAAGVAADKKNSASSSDAMTDIDKIRESKVEVLVRPFRTSASR